IERRSGGIKSCFSADDVAAGIEGGLTKVDRFFLACILNHKRPIEKMNLRAVASAGHLQNVLFQLFPGQIRGFAADESLPRSGSLPTVRRYVGVAGKQVEFIERRSKGIRANL